MSPARQASPRTPDRFERDGRVLVTRAALCEEFAIGDSTARTWWRDRDTNNHPEPVHREGRRQWWDLEAMRAFVDTVRNAAARREQPPATIEHEGRTLINRPGMAERYRLDAQWLAVLYHYRRSNGHPEPVRRFERFLYFDQAETDAWNDEREAAKRSSLTPIDRRGEPDELVDITEATHILGYKSESTIRSFLSPRHGDYFPGPDARGSDGRPHWHRSTLWEFGDRRRGPGRDGDPRTPDRFERDGRVLVTRAAICEEFAIGESTTRTWWRERAANDHPEPVHREGRRQWWDLEAMREFVATMRNGSARRGARQDGHATRPPSRS